MAAIWPTASASGESLLLQLRSQRSVEGALDRCERLTRQAEWDAAATAIIVCDVWDYHHCLNAVRRLEEFAPRLNKVLQEGRRRGAIVIHAPSDCMPAYESHPARRRALETPRAAALPRDIELWRSRIPREEGAVYPIDQSDGGEDDDPQEHAEWAAHLKSLGRNPNMPWQAQSPLIEIDAERDYISDRGDEVWSILQDRKIEHVILTGVHVNMCVLGRPFGLRQLAANGMDVALMRDMTDAMYNPRRWPHVDHFTGTDLVISYIERHVCPTITSDQLLGGEPFRSKFDTRAVRDVAMVESTAPREWSPIDVPLTASNADTGVPTWYRCAVQVPANLAAEPPLRLAFEPDTSACQVWLNGQPLPATLELPGECVSPTEANLLVVRVAAGAEAHPLMKDVELVAGQRRWRLHGRWQMRRGDDPHWSNMPLPAKFGLSPDMLFEVGPAE